MIKSIILSLNLLLLVTVVNAQMVIEGGINGVLVETKSSSTLKEIEGSPYLDEDFKPGEVKIEGKDAIKAFLRYDVSTENMEIKMNLSDSRIYKLSPTLSAKYEIDNHKFIYDRINYNGKIFSGFFKAHYEGEDYTLLEKPVVEIQKAQKAKSGYEKDKPAQISIDSEYFITKEKGTVYKVRIKHRDMKKHFRSKEAKIYLDDHKIRTLDDLKNFLENLNQ